MDGKDSGGRRICLLNEDERKPTIQLVYRPPPTRPTVEILPSISPSFQSRLSSYRSSPIESPPTPPLMRSDSSDSSAYSDTAAMQTPSPTTPDFPADARYQLYDTASIYPSRPLPEYSMSYDLSNLRGMLGAPSPYDAPLWADLNRAQQATESRAVAASANRSKKNSYPCPMAKQYGCNDYFTTSGHAARHAKKHTGKKDAVCPDCNKAFTRKDNMEQHRRTHQSGRKAAAVGEDRVKKSAKQQMKRPKPAPIQASLSPVSLLVDPALSPSRLLPTSTSPPTYSYDQAYPHRSPYPDPNQIPRREYFPPAETLGLHTLAFAASGEKRKYEGRAV